MTAAGTSAALVPNPIDIGGSDAAALLTYTGNYTAEPTTLTVIKQWLVTPYGGNLVIQFRLGREPEADATTNKGIAIRLTAPAAVNARGYIELTRSA